jgi:hypothetical protein
MRMDNSFFTEAYRNYREALAIEPDFSRYADYDWQNLPEELNASWLLYSLMLSEYSRSLANMINQLGDYSRRLGAWGKNIEILNETEQLEALFEFVDPIATISLTLPYAIQSRFNFVIAHLSHQANKAKLKTDWKDNIPEDDKICSATAKKLGAYWSRFPALEASVGNIFSKEHRNNTDEFRHKFTHRVPTQVILGHSLFVRRHRDKAASHTTYEFGDKAPIDIKASADELKQVFLHCIVAFDDFKALIAEQVASIKINNAIP